MKIVKIYTDGSCLGNGKDNAPGGYAALAIYNGVQRTVSGGICNTTNNRAEMVSVIEGLELLTEPCNVTIVTDSMYIVNTMTKGWKRNTNEDLWNMIDKGCKTHNITWEWVKGHNEDMFNECVNALAQTAAAKVASGQALEIVKYGERKKDESSQETLDLFKEDS